MNTAERKLLTTRVGFSPGLLAALAAALLQATGCGSHASSARKLEFWHTRAGNQQKALEAIVKEFNDQSGGPPIVPVYVGGNYRDVRTKVMAGIAAHRLPLLSVCYESQVQEYAAANVVRPLDDLIGGAKDGLSQQDLDDFYPQFLQSNRFARYGNQLLSFPFTKSLLVMAYNQTLLEGLGFHRPPQTWSDLVQQAQAARQKTGQTPVPFVIDASTLDGMIYSFGGDVLAPDGKATLFEQPPTLHMLTLLRDMARQQLLTDTRGSNTAGLFAGAPDRPGQVPFLFGTSSGRSNLEEQVQNRFKWDIAILPHAPGVTPVTVLYGPNVCIFKSTPENDRLGWRFVRYFTTPPVTARWSRETGYLPVRKSALQLPEMHSFFRSNPRALHASDILPSAKVEPNVPNWDEVRHLIEDAANRVIHQQQSPEEAARQLKQKSDAALAKG